jgi:cyclophilin family peptidyl-prolyl cis-trans isomerase/HEAT repeat protein
VLRIEDTRRDEPAFLDSLLASARATRRARAALAAGRIGARTHLTIVRRLVADPDSAVAATAFFALSLLHDTAAISAASSALRGTPGVAIEAARLLGELGDSARAAIIGALADSSLDPAVRGAVLLAAARLRPVPASAVTPWLSDTDGSVAWRAAYVLARGRSPAGVRPLLAVAGSREASVREQVARGLSRPVAGDSLGDRAQRVLELLARDESSRVRVNAVRALATYGRSARAELISTLNDVDAGVRLAAAQSLGSVLDSTAAAWQGAFGADTALVVQQAIAEGAAGQGILLTAARPWRASRDWRRRAASVGLDARGVATESVERLRDWMTDPDARVRATAASAIAALVDSATARDSARGILRAALEDHDVAVRAAALSGLASGASTADLALALDAYLVARRDRDADARLAFWQLADSALTRAGGALPDSLARRLDALPRPADPLEREAASRTARFATWSDATGTARPLAWYEARVREVMRQPAPVARLETSRGTIELTLFAQDAPLTVYNFVSLARRNYFDGQRFHRVVSNFVVQAGDPRGDGNGGPGYAIRDEINRHRYLRGTLGMALSGPNTGGSQFFVTHSPQPHLDGGYTVFGQLRSGGATLDRIVQGDRIVRIRIR